MASLKLYNRHHRPHEKETMNSQDDEARKQLRTGTRGGNVMRPLDEFKVTEKAATGGYHRPPMPAGDLDKLCSYFKSLSPNKP